MADGQLELRTNFGGNRRWYSRCYRPTNEAEVLELLARHRGERIRVLGSLHSWSDIASGADVSLDMSAFSDVEPFTRDGRSHVRVGAGSTLQALLDRLHARTDQTLPTLGAIKKQTISGAISTATHGSGRQSLSHFVTALRVGAFDGATGEPVIVEYRDGAELKAARCGLGCMGVILAVEILTVPKYKVSEVVRLHGSLEELLEVFPERPLTQFMCTPYHWKWIAFERAPLASRRASLRDMLIAYFFRIYGRLGLDIAFHLGVLASRWLGLWAVRGFFKIAPYSLIRNVQHVDDSHRVLTMAHHYFRHEEMELFVLESKLAEATNLLRSVIDVFAGMATAPSPAIAEQLRSIDMYDELLERRGTYVHHYVLFFRRVLPEETLISMAASVGGPIYSISVFTYTPPGKRQPYYAMCSFIARSLNRLLAARLHWGKHFPLGYADVAALYPELETFRSLCRRADPAGVLRNAYTERVLGLPSGTPAAETANIGGAKA
jgi:L-gulono-1,4-lactone dehydrogenase